MNATRCIRSPFRWLASGVGLAAAEYATYVGATGSRYGQPRHESSRKAADPLFDRFMPEFEVVERCRVRVAAPAEITWSAACDMDLQQSAIVRGIFNARGTDSGQRAGRNHRSTGLLAQMKAWGWSVPAEIPDREIVFGAVTQPWMANVVFRALPADEFGAFQEPGYVKIVWILGADPIGPTESIARTETRAATTDPTARARFWWYWSCFLPGIVLIRRVLLGLVKAEAERRAREARSERRTAKLLGCPRR